MNLTRIPSIYSVGHHVMHFSNLCSVKHITKSMFSYYLNLDRSHILCFSTLPFSICKKIVLCLNPPNISFTINCCFIKYALTQPSWFLFEANDLYDVYEWLKQESGERSYALYYNSLKASAKEEYTKFAKWLELYVS